MHRSVRGKGRRLIVLSSSMVFGCVSPLLAQTPVRTVAVPPANTSSTGPYSAKSAFNYNSAGVLFAWDGQTVYEQAGSSFDVIGIAPSGNHADPGPITFSANASQILFSNGFGGNNSGGIFNGKIFSLPTPVSVPISNAPQGTLAGTVPYNYDLIPVPTTSALSGGGTNYFVDAGSASFSSSSVSLFNASNGSTQPVINNIPGASTAQAINRLTNTLYVGNGYDSSGTAGPGGSNDTGDIRAFSLSTLANGPMNFSQGTLFDPAGLGVQNASSLFFDKDGYLFSDGSDGIVVFNSSGGAVYKQDPSGSYVDDVEIAYDPVTDQVLQAPTDGTNNAELYNATSFEPTAVPEPAGIAILAIGGVMALRRRHR